MKKTVRINISGQVFNIDDDAFLQLEAYINEINRRFGNQEEGDEIVSDIESRIAEIFHERMFEGKDVVNIEDVEYVIDTMGTPEEISEEDEPIDEEASVHSPGKKRRMYRDIDNKLIAGVCSGIAAYFNIDVIIIRVLFIILFFVGYGSMAVIYILLWIFVPSAITTAQKLEMRGEDVTISNIEKSIRDEFDGVRRNFEKFTKSKKYENVKTGADRVLHGSINLIEVILKIIMKFIGVIFIITGFISFSALAISLFFSRTFLRPAFVFDDIPPINEVLTLFGTNTEINFSLFAIFILIGIPFLVLTFIGLKLMIKFRSNNLTIGLVALGVWIIALSSLIYIGFNHISKFRAKGKAIKTESLSYNRDTIYVQLNENVGEIYDKIEIYDFENHQMTAAFFDGEFKVFGETDFDIKRSMDDKFHIEIVKAARGSTRNDAKEEAEMIEYNWNMLDTSIVVHPYYFIGENNQWRRQELSFILRVPIDKTVYLKDNLEKVLNDVNNINNFWDYEMGGKFWKMTRNGLMLSTQENDTIISHNDDIDNEKLQEMKNELKN